MLCISHCSPCRFRFAPNNAGIPLVTKELLPLTHRRASPHFHTAQTDLITSTIFTSPANLKSARRRHRQTPSCEMSPRKRMRFPPSSMKDPSVTSTIAFLGNTPLGANRSSFCITTPICSPQNAVSLVQPGPVVPQRTRVTPCMTAVPTPSETSAERFSLRLRREQDKELCVLVGVDVTSRSKSGNRIFSLAESLEELSRLAETAGMKVVGTVTQALSTPMSATYIGTGKVAEVRQEMEAAGCKTCIFDVELSPAQQRTLEHEFGGEAKGIKVLDRTALILDIFAQHAATKEGQLQVELALYQYRLPRLTRMWTHLERQSGAGGVGLRGPGETQLESDRRMINTRINKLKRDLELVRGHRTRQRSARRRNVGLPVVALIGYTNAGKSTLLNALTGADALAANALFATLDPTTRRASLEGLKLSPEILLTDTVGFVQNLPTQLVAAFRATLEEVADADMLLHVVDGSTDEELMAWQMQAVEDVLEQIGASGKPTIVVVNKADKMSEKQIRETVERIEKYSEWECVAVSAKTGMGLEDVGVVIDEVLRDILLSVEVVIPYNRGDLISAIYTQGCVQGEKHIPEGTRLAAKVPGGLYNRLKKYFIESADGTEGRTQSAGSHEDTWADLAKNRHSSQ